MWLLRRDHVSKSTSVKDHRRTPSISLIIGNGFYRFNSISLQRFSQTDSPPFHQSKKKTGTLKCPLPQIFFFLHQKPTPMFQFQLIFLVFWLSAILENAQEFWWQTHYEGGFFRNYWHYYMFISIFCVF